MNAMSEAKAKLAFEFCFEVTQTLRGHLSPEVAADVLGVTMDTLRRWRRLGKGPQANVMEGRLCYEIRETTFYAYFGDGVHAPTRKSVSSRYGSGR
jgi:hypothetical protein